VRRPTREDTGFVANIATILVTAAMAIGWLASWPLSTVIVVARVLALIVGPVLVGWALIESGRMLAAAIRSQLEGLRQDKRLDTALAEREITNSAPAASSVRGKSGASRKSASPFSGWTLPPQLAASFKLPEPPSYIAPSIDLPQLGAAAEAAEQLRRIETPGMRAAQESVRHALAQYGSMLRTDWSRHFPPIR
jgi:hypothetical protein